MAKPKLSRLYAKKMRRTIMRSPLQFLAIVFITVLASTLFLGLTSSYMCFESRVNTLYKESNFCDIYTTVTTDDSYDYKVDLEGIKNAVNEKAKFKNNNVESRYYGSSQLNGYNATILMFDDYPTINKDYTYRFKKNNEKEDFFIIDRRYASQTINYGGKKVWLTEDYKDYKPVNFTISIRDLKSKLGESIIYQLTTKARNQGKKNILDADDLTLSITPTGDMTSAENVIDTTDYVPVNFISRSFLEKSLKSLFKETYGEWNEPLDKTSDEYQAWYVVNNPKEKIINALWKNNQFMTKLSDDRDSKVAFNAIFDYFNNKSKNNLGVNLNRETMPSCAVLNSDVKQSKQLTYVFPALFFLVSILVVLTTFSQTVLKERGEIGTLKAMGVSNKSIISYYILLTIVIMFVGILLGAIIGPCLIPNLLGLKYNMLYNLPSQVFVFPWLATLLMTLGLFLITGFITFVIAKKEVKLKPVESMRPKAPKSIKIFKKNKNITLSKFLINSNKVKKDNLINILNSDRVKVNNLIIHDKNFKIDLFSDIVTLDNEKIPYFKRNKFLSLNLALRNIAVSIPRSLMVVIGVLGCTGLLCCGFGVDDSLSHAMGQDINNFFSNDFIVKYNDQSKADKNIKNIMDSHNVSYTPRPYCNLPVSIFNENDEAITSMIYFINCRDDNFIKFSNFINEKTLENPINGEKRPCHVKPGVEFVWITSKVAKNLNINIGERITFSIGSLTHRAYVSNIMDTFYVHGIFADITYKEFIGYNTAYTNCYIKLTDKDQKNDKNLIKQLTQELKTADGVSGLMERQEAINSMQGAFDTLGTITMVIKVFAILLAVITLYNLALLNYRERIRDVATMKVLGFNRIEISKSLVIEIMILSFIGICIGLSLGLPFEILVLMTNQNSIIEFMYYIAPLSMIYSFLITFVTAFIVNAFLGFKTRKIKMVESLKSIE